MTKQDLGPEQKKDSGQVVEDLLREVEKQDEQEYIEDVTLKQQILSEGEVFDGASLKLNDELISQIKTAIESRIIATSSYTKERVNQINENYQNHEDNMAVASDGEATSQTYFGEIYNNDEDWVDQLYIMFNELPDKFEVSDIEDNLDKFVPQKLDVREGDESKQPFRMLRSFLNMLKPEHEEKDIFYFQKKEIIKTIMKDAIDKAGFIKELEDFFRMGVISGEFCTKDKYGPSSTSDIVCDDEMGTYKLVKDQSYLFKPIDTRTLIFPKTNRRWVIEKINTTFSEVLGMCLDEDNKVKDNSPYDMDMLKKVGEYIAEKGSKQVKKPEPDSASNAEDYSADILTEDVEKLWDIDGDITIYECHNIPLMLDIKKTGKMPYKTLIHCFNMSKDDLEDNKPDMLPIGCRLTPYTAGLAYHFAPMIKRDGQMSGMGLPEKLKPLQTLLNDFMNHSIDIANLALWGIMVIDPDAFKDTLSMRNLVPRQILKLKDMKGRDIKQVVQWLHPTTDSMQMVDNLLPRIDDMIKRTSRKGPGSQRIAPKVSATEAQSIIHELQKNVNKVALRLNNLFLDVLYRMYIYTVINRLEPFRVKSSGYRINKTEIQGQDDYKTIEKLIDIDPKQLLISGVNFKLVGIDATDKKAVANQQKMQAFQLISSSGALRNPDGGPHIMTDDAGSKVAISEYKVYKEILNDMNFDDVIERVKPEQMQQAVPQGGVPGHAGTAPSGAPPLTASPQAGNVAKQAAISKGINV